MVIYFSQMTDQLCMRKPENSLRPHPDEGKLANNIWWIRMVCFDGLTLVCTSLWVNSQTTFGKETRQTKFT